MANQIKSTAPFVSYGRGIPNQDIFPDPVIIGRAPTTADQGRLGQLWIDTSTADVYVLGAITSGIKNWEPITAGGLGDITTLAGDTGTASGSTVNILGTTNQITTTGDNASTLTISIPTNPVFDGTPSATGGFDLGTTEYTVQVGNATGGLTSLATGLAGQILTSAGAAADPDWTTATYPSTIDEGDVLIGTGADQVGVVATAGAISGYVLTANGSGTAPTWESGSFIDLGTTQYAVQVGNASGGLASLSTGTAGQVLTSGGPSADPSWQPNSGGPMVINPQTSSYVLQLIDAEALVTMTVTTTANTVTVPLYSSVAFPVGTVIWVSQLGTGTTQIIPVSGAVTINSVAGATHLFAQYSLCSLVNLANNVWLLTGDII